MNNPLLIASIESLTAIQSQLESALVNKDDGRGHRPITQLDAAKLVEYYSIKYGKI